MTPDDLKNGTDLHHDKDDTSLSEVPDNQQIIFPQYGLRFLLRVHIRVRCEYMQFDLIGKEWTTITSADVDIACLAFHSQLLSKSIDRLN